MGPSVSTSAEKYTSRTPDLAFADADSGDSASQPHGCSASVPMLSDHINKSRSPSWESLGGPNPMVISEFIAIIGFEWQRPGEIRPIFPQSSLESKDLLRFPGRSRQNRSFAKMNDWQEDWAVVVVHRKSRFSDQPAHRALSIWREI